MLQVLTYPTGLETIWLTCKAKRKVLCQKGTRNTVNCVSLIDITAIQILDTPCIHHFNVTYKLSFNFNETVFDSYTCFQVWLNQSNLWYFVKE